MTPAAAGERFHGDTVPYRLWTTPPLREKDIGRSRNFNTLLRSLDS